MDRTLLSALVLISFAVSIAPRDMDGEVFIFPKNTEMSHVSLQAKLVDPLENFTLCLRTFTDIGYKAFLFHYRTTPNVSEIIISKSSPTSYTMQVGQDSATFKTPEATNQWVHLCFSWESVTGIARLWVNSQPVPRKGLSKGYYIYGNPVIKLGYKRRVYDLSYVGEMCDVSMWNYVLSRDEVFSSMRRYQNIPTGNILSWRALQYEIIDYVVVKPL